MGTYVRFGDLVLNSARQSVQQFVQLILADRLVGHCASLAGCGHVLDHATDTV